MAKLTRAIVASFFFLFLGQGWGVAEEGWVIKSFDTQVTVNPDARISVVETIKVNFQVSKHGIYRDIPIKYKNFRGKRVKLRLKLRGVTSEGGTPYETKVSREGANLRIRIGDPDTTVTGEKTYVIRYDVPWAVGYFKDYDEIYWNASGHNWPVTMERATATVVLPAELGKDRIQAAIYAGPLGAGEGGGQWWYEAPDKVHFEADGPLPPGQGLTVSVGWPKGMVRQPDAFTRAGWFLSDYLPLILPILVWVGAIWMVWTRGRDPAGRGTIAVQYEPPEGMTPAEVGTLADERMQIKDLSAMIVDLAVRGYLKIVEEEGFLGLGKKYSLELKKKDYPEDQGLKEFEKKILSALFATDFLTVVSLKELPASFARKANEARNDVYEALVTKRLFDSNPAKVRSHYVVLGIVLVFSAFFLGPVTQSGVWMASFVAMGLPWIVLCWLMPRRTLRGVVTREQILGFKDYLATAERDRMKFYEQEKIFDKYLPFAMALGVAHLWAKAFEGILKEKREWYQGSVAGASFAGFSAGDFSSSLSSSFGSALSAASGGSGSGGGGSSGGGGGGGGGGSW